MRGWCARAAGALLAIALVSAPAWAGPYTRLQVLLPGESPAPGTVSGRTGTALAQTAGVPFDVVVRACDDQWNLVNTVSHVVQVLASDASATLPPAASLSSGSRTFRVTLNAGGQFTFTAHDQTDGTIPDGASSLVRSLVLQGFEFSRITQKNQYAGTPMTVTVTARDPNGNIVTGYDGPVRLKEITSYGDGRCSPEVVSLSNGSWTGPVTMYRADETSINRGNVNLYAWLEAAPSKNGTSDPFTVHPGPFSRLQIVVPGTVPLPGSVSGLTGTPASQAAGVAFVVGVYGTDAYWNPVPASDNVRITSNDPAATLPASAALVNGYRAFNVTLGTVGTRTLTASDQSNGGIQSHTSAGISVLPSAAHHFDIAPIASPQAAGQPVTVTIRAVDASNNTVPAYAGDALLSANTGSGSITPSQVTFVNGEWTGPVTFYGAGGAVALTCADFSAPPHTGTSNSFTVSPGPHTGFQVLVPGESPRGGTDDGREGAPTATAAGNLFNVTVRAVDDWWNLVPGVNARVALSSTDAFASMSAETTLADGQRLVPVRLYKVGPQKIVAASPDVPGLRPDSSSAIPVTGGPFARVLVLAPGESPAPGTATGRTGTATDQSINYAFTCTVLATDAWWNPVAGPTDVVRLTSGDPLAQLPPPTAMVNGRADMVVRLATGGFQQITVSDQTDPTKTGSTTQVRAISSGFHLEADVSPGTVAAGAPFTLTVRVTNDAGSVIQEINSFVTVEVRNANSQAAGRGTLLTTQFQLLQGQRAIAQTYTFAEPVVFVVRDDAGNAPGITGVLNVVPGPPAAIQLASVPAWVGGNKHATLGARVVDAYDNGIPGRTVGFSVVQGAGTVAALDSLTDTTGTARADFLSPREPETGRVRAVSGAVSAELEIQTAFVDPNAAGGHVTNYPNPFRPEREPTTIAWKLADHANVRLRIFTLTGDLVRSEEFARGAVGGTSGLNTWAWDGLNGDGRMVASGGYLALIEAEGTGETLHVMRRKIAVVR